MTKYKTAREIAAAITRGELPNQHLGPKNAVILKQEIFSLKNSYNPDTMTEQELLGFNTKLAGYVEELDQLTSTQEKEAIEKEIDVMLNP